MPQRMEIEGSPAFNNQCHQISDESGFGSDEGGEFNAPDFAYFILLQEELKYRKKEAQKIHAPQWDKNVEYRGRNYLVRERTCLWTGERLFILSRQHTREGSASIFRRIVTVPESAEDPLQFYAMITPRNPKTITITLSEYLDYLKELTNEYQSSYKAYLDLYPYVKPQLLTYQSGIPLHYNSKESIMFPALLTRSIGSWKTIYTLLKSDEELSAKGFLAIMGWFVCVLMLQKSSLVHCDMSDANVTVFGPGVLCQLIDLGNLVHLDQGCAHISNHPLATYPDHCASDAAFDLHSDVFSVAMNLLMYYAVDYKSENKVFHKLEHMVDNTNRYFNSHQKERKDHYSPMYDKLKKLTIKPLYACLDPHLLDFVNPDRNKRTPVLNIFSDQDIMEMIYGSLNKVIDCKDYASLFTDVGDLTLRDSINLLRDNADKQGIAVTSILLLLVYALHCRTLDEEVRIDHKKKIEMILEGMPLSPNCQTLLDRYETPFPGRRTDNLIDPAIDDSESEIIELLFKEAYYENIYTECGVTLQNLTARVEHLTNRQECKTILRHLSERVEHLVTRDVCETTLQQLSERVEHLTNREKCKTTLLEQPNRVEKNSRKNDGESTLFSFAVNICLFDSAHTNSPEEVLSDCKSHTNHNR